MKAHLVYKIMTIIKDRGLTQEAAADIMGVTQPEVSTCCAVSFGASRVEKLLNHLVALGQDVEILVEPHLGTKQAPQVSVA